MRIFAQKARSPVGFHPLPKRLCPLFFLLFLGSCSGTTQLETDLNQVREIPLVYSGSGHVHGLNLNFQGTGHGELELYERDKKYTQWTLKGPFKDSYGGDWYTPGGKLVWKPSPGQSQGKLQIDYQFRD